MGVADPESGIREYAVSVGVAAPSDQSVLGRSTLDGGADLSSFTSRPVPSLDHTLPYYVTLYAINGANKETVISSNALYFDISPPTIRNSVVVIPNFKVAKYVMGVLANLSLGAESATCLLDTDVVSVMFNLPEGEESAESFRFELGVGVVPGGDDIMSYETFLPLPLPAATDNDGTVLLYHRIHSLDFDPAGRGGVYFSVRVFSTAGHFSTIVSNAVFIKSNLTLERNWIFDGFDSGTDIEYQTSTYEIGSSFSFGVNCPIRDGRWAVEGVDGNLTQAYVNLDTVQFQQEFNQFHVSSDQVRLYNDETYRILVQVTDFSGEVHILRSNGVTVTTLGLAPGVVRDGTIPEQDLNYQESQTTLSACWEGFGDGSPEQNIAYYQVAAGTNLEHPSTRTNIAPFTNVGLNTSHTFTGLELVAEVVEYFITVRAYSVARATSDAHSNGVVAGFSHSILPGAITLPRYQADTTTLSAHWTEFESGVPIRQYEWALSSAYFTSEQLEEFCADTNSNYSDFFDVSGFSHVGLDTSVTLTGLHLQDNTTYHFTLRVLDQAKKCTVVMFPEGVTIDQTPPTSTASTLTTPAVTLGPSLTSAESVIYLSSGEGVTVEWAPFADLESGVEHYEVGIYQQVACGNNTGVGVSIVDVVRTNEDVTQVDFTNVPLEVGVAYVGVVTATNGAGVSGSVYSEPGLLDVLSPVAGNVKDGETWYSDVTYQSDLSMLSAVFTHAKLPPPTPGVTANEPCPRASFFALSDLDPEWAVVPSPELIGYATSAIAYSPQQVSASSGSPSGVSIVTSRDPTSPIDEVISGAYQTPSDPSNGGTFQADILVATGLEELEVNTVTSVLFIDSGVSSNLLAKFEPEQATFDLGSASSVPYSAFGVQIYREITEDATTFPQRVVMWAFDADSINQPIHVRRDLPSVDLSTVNTYRVDFEAEQQDTYYTRTARLSINGVLMATLQGLPSLSNDTRVVLHNFNRLGFTPQTGDPGVDLAVRTVFANVTVPRRTGSLCDAGTPFHSRQSPIVEFRAWAGTSPGLADVAEMEVSVHMCRAMIVWKIVVLL